MALESRGRTDGTLPKDSMLMPSSSPFGFSSEFFAPRSLSEIGQNHGSVALASCRGSLHLNFVLTGFRCVFFVGFGFLHFHLFFWLCVEMRFRFPVDITLLNGGKVGSVGRRY